MSIIRHGPGRALILGASRGLGFALVQEWLERGWEVIATVRQTAPELDRLADQHIGRLTIERVDIAIATGVSALAERLAGQIFDILFINAGIARAIDATPVSADEADFLDMMLVNALSPVRAAEILRELVRTNGVIAVMSSGLGSIADPRDGWQLYSASKAALNMLMKKYSLHHAADGHALLLVAPGWIRTEMGGADAPLAIGDSIPLVVDTIEANRGKPGLRYLDRFNTPIAW